MAALAEVFRLHGAEYRAKFPGRLLPSQLAALRDIENCRTPALGGSLYACPNCPQSLEYSYHSCGNRACPKCGNDHTTAWLEQQRNLLLPTDYFLVTYTLPRECRHLARAHHKQVYSAFFRASAQSLIDLAQDPKHLGRLPGMVGVLQTWRRDMGYHVHIHYIVPGGALSPGADRWLPHRYRQWLVPEKALAARFKKRFKAELEKLGLLDLVDPKVWRRCKKWVVDCLHVGSGEEVLKYLAPYVYRVAISNNRIEKIENGEVTFRFKHGENPILQSTTLPVDEFIRRFLQHVLPKGFVKVRYYGFLAARNRKQLLPVILKLIGACRPPKTLDTLSNTTSNPRTPREHRCPHCGALMVNFLRLRPQPRQRDPPP